MPLVRLETQEEIRAAEGCLCVKWHYDQELQGQRGAFHTILSFQLDEQPQPQSATEVQRKRQKTSTEDGTAQTESTRGVPRSFARATVIVEHSAKFFDVFAAYFRVFIVAAQSAYEWDQSTCPTWMHRFSLADFNDRLRELHEYLASGGAMHAQQAAQFTTWQEQGLFDPASVPKAFALLVADYNDGEVCLFPIKTVHAVIGAPDADITRLKVIMGFFTEFSYTAADETGFALGPNGDRSGARSWEMKRVGNERKLFPIMFERQHVARAHRRSVRAHMFSQSIAQLLPNEETEREDEKEKEEKEQEEGLSEEGWLEAQQSMDAVGVAVVQCNFPPELRIHQRVSLYLRTLLGLPKGFQVMRTAHARAFHSTADRKHRGLHVSHLRRKRDDARTQHVQASHGNTHYGAACPAVLEIGLLLAPLLNKFIFRDTPRKLITTEICIQAPTPANET